MKGLLVLACAAALLPLAQAASPPARIERDALVFDGIPASDPARTARLGQYLQSRQAGFIDWLADGSLLIRTRFGDTEQLHRVRAPLGQREQLTFDADPVRQAAASPEHPDSVVTVQDHDGDEQTQLSLFNLADGSTRPLTELPSQNTHPLWSNSGRRIAYTRRSPDGAGDAVFVTDIDAGATAKRVAGGNGQHFTVQDWSLDDQKLLVIQHLPRGESTLGVVDLQTGTLTQIAPDAKSKAPPTVSAARFSRDGRGVYFVSTHEGDFAELRYTDLYTRATHSLAPQTRYDVEQLALSRDGRYLAYTLNEAGPSRLVVHDLSRKADLLLPPLPPASRITSLGFEASGSRLAVSAESAQAPGDVYVYELTADPTLVRWTQSERGPLRTAPLVPAEAFRYPTWDRVDGEPRQIPGFLYQPRTPGPHPVILHLHGGPESQFRPGWDAFTQYLVNELGFVVIAPNLRGASGYGRGYLTLDDGPRHEHTVRDIGSLLVWIGMQPDLDRNRVVVMGGSFGGDRALAALTHYNDRLVGAVAFGDEADPERHVFPQRGPALTPAASIRRPLLLIQGLNDPRVPAADSALKVAQIRAAGGEVEYLTARNEGHGFRRKPNQDASLETVADFLLRVAGP